jgi:redox-sensitive bicupin YhaK (pirin superfamily)
MAEAVFLSLLTADKVITEAGNNKKTIIGTFTNFHSVKFPVVFPSWAIYCAVTNLEGEHSFSLNVVGVSNAVLFSFGGKLQVENTEAVIEIAVPVANTQFPERGKYRVVFGLDENVIASRLLNVKQIQQSGGFQ